MIGFIFSGRRHAVPTAFSTILIVFATTFAGPQRIIPRTQPEKPAPKSETPPAPAPAKPSLLGTFDEQAELARLSALDPEPRVPGLTDFLKTHPQSPLLTAAKQLLAQAHSQRGELALRAGKVDEAKEAFKQALAALPTPLTAFSFRTFVMPMPVALARYGYRNDAVLLMRDVQQQVWSDPDLVEQVGQFYVGVEDPANAIVTFDRALELDGNRANFHYERGIALQIGLRLDDALAAYKRAGELDPRHRNAFGAMADLNRAVGAFKEAEELYRKQIDIDPQHPTAWGGLTLALLEQNRDADALDPLGKMLAINAGDVRFLTQLAYLCAARGEFPNSAKILDRVREINPRYPWAKIVEAHAKRVNGDYAEAENILGEALETAKFATLYFELGKTLVLAHDYDGALETFENFLTVTPEGEFETTLGGALQARGSGLARLLEAERRAAILMDDPLTKDEQFQQVERYVRFAYAAKAAQAELAAKPKSDAAPTVTEPVASDEPRVTRRRRVAAEESPRTETAMRPEEWQPPMPGDTPVGRALTDFIAVKDDTRAFRYLYAARQLAEAETELPAAESLATGAVLFAGEATTREDSLRDMPGLSAEARKKYFAAQARTTLGWVLYKEGKRDEAIAALKAAETEFDRPLDKKPVAWKLGVVLESQGKLEDALVAYKSGYDGAGATAALQKSIIEAVYKKIHGSLDGLTLDQ